MLSVIASLALLASMSALGIAILGRVGRHLTRLERIAYGAPLGMVIGTLALIPPATLVGLRPEIVIEVGLACLVVAVALTGWPPLRIDRAAMRFDRATLRRISLLPTILVGVIAARWAVFWADALSVGARGMTAGHVNIWGDWPVHLGIVSSFAYGANFPPEHPRFAGHAFAYHYLSDLTAAAQVALGMDPWTALVLHSYIGDVLVAVGLYAFARRVVRDRRTAVLAVVLFLLGSGLAWVAAIGTMTGTGDIGGALTGMAANEPDLNLRFVNMFYGFIAPQRAMLYGLPLAFAIVSTLLVAVRTADVRLFVVAGALAGLLPFANLGTLLALAIVSPILVLLFPSRAWLAFFATWIVVAVPQLLTQLGGGAGALAALRIQLGWVSAPDAWPWFWIKNLGWFAPLVIAGLLARRLLGDPARRFAWAFMALFVIANVVVFQPWDWDDHKLLVYWFLFVAMVVAALLVRIWDRRRGRVTRAVLVAITLSMVMTGIFEDVGAAIDGRRFQMLDADQMTLATAIRERTPPDALFISGMENHDPVAMLTGRRIYVGYANWLWTEGIPYQGRTAQALSIYRADPGFDALMARIGIDFVVIGPHERDDLHADEAAFRARYPVLVAVGAWTVYDVRGAARS